MKLNAGPVLTQNEKSCQAENASSQTLINKILVGSNFISLILDWEDLSIMI